MKRLLASRVMRFIPSVVSGGLLCLSTQVEAATILQQDFQGCVALGGAGTTIGIASNTVLSSFANVGLAGWAGDHVYCAAQTNAVVQPPNYMVKIGASGSLGWIEAPPLDLSGNNGNFAVTCRAGAWNGNNEVTAIYVEHHTGSGVDRLATLTLSKTAMQPFTVYGTNGTASSVIRFTARVASNNRFFLDDVLIEEDLNTLHIGTAAVHPAVFAGEEATARIVATDSGAPIAVEVDSTDIPEAYSFDGEYFSWTPQVTGSYYVRFVATNATDSVFHTLNLTVSLPAPAAPTVEAAAGSLRLSWDPVPGATGYSVQAYRLATEVELFSEAFDGCTIMGGGVSPTTIAVRSNTAISNRLDEVGLDGWSGAAVYCASNTVKGAANYLLGLGTTSAKGWIQTPPLDLSANGGACVLTLRAGAWDYSSEKLTVDVSHISGGGLTTNALDTLALSKTAMAGYTVAVTGGTSASVICVTAKDAQYNRFLLDDVRLFYVTAARIEVPGSQIVIDGTTARVFGLPPWMEYLCTVTATDGAEETVSPEVSARTTGPTVILVR